MKRIIVIFILVMSCISCSDEKRNDQQNDLPEMKASDMPKTYTSYNGKASNFIRTDSVFLFNAATEAELKDNMSVFASFDNEVKSAMEGYNETKGEAALKADLATYQLYFTNKNAYVTDLVFWNAGKKVAVDVIPYNAEPVYDRTIANCSDAWSGGQSYSSEESIKQASYNIFMESFLKDDCVQIQYVKSFITVKLCYKLC